jgi:hypothetical protein
MKHILLTLALVATTSTSFGDCYNFINGRGPDRIGNENFAAVATQLCVTRVNGFARNYTSLEFSDSQGVLAIVAANPSDYSLEATSANINGKNVDLTGTRFDINVRQADSLNAVIGTISVKAGRDFPQLFSMIKI